MPSALQQSRDILAQGVARVRSGLNNYGRNLDQQGPEIAVTPFDAQNVSTPAALIKLGTSIAAARRRKANLDAAQEGLALEREKTRAEIAKLRAEAVGKPSPADLDVIGSDIGPYKKGMPRADVRLDISNRSAESSAKARAEALRRSGRVSAASAGMAATTADIERRTSAGVDRRMAVMESLFAEIARGGPRMDEALEQVGISPKVWKDLDNDQVGRVQLLAHAREGLRSRAVARTRAEIERHPRFAGKRAGYQAIIDEGVGGFEEDPRDPLGLGADDNPLGLGGP